MEQTDSFTFTGLDLPLEVWHRLFALLGWRAIVKLTRLCSKAVLEWSWTAITEVSAFESICGVYELKRPNLSRIILPLGFSYSLDLQNQLNIAGTQLLELELGKHHPIHLEGLARSMPVLQRLVLGGKTFNNSVTWHFLPRSIQTLTLKDVTVTAQKGTQKPRLVVSQNGKLSCSPFDGMPSALKKLSITKYNVLLEDAGVNVIFLEQCDLEPYMSVYEDFIGNGLMKLRLLEHLHLPSYLDIVFYAQNPDLDLYASLPPSTWLSRDMVALPTLKHLSCVSLTWIYEPDTLALGVTARANCFPDFVSSERLESSLDLQRLTFQDIFPNLLHFEVYYATLAPIRKVSQNRPVSGFPATLISYHDLHAPLDYSVQVLQPRIAGKKVECAQEPVFLASGLVSLSLPIVSDLWQTIANCDPHSTFQLLRYLALTHAVVDEAAAAAFAFFRLVPPSALRLDYFNVEFRTNIRTSGPPLEGLVQILTAMKTVTANFERNADIMDLLTRIPSLKWVSVFGFEILHPMYREKPDSSPFERIMEDINFIPTLFSWFSVKELQSSWTHVQDKLKDDNVIKIPIALDRIRHHENDVSKEIRAAALSSSFTTLLHPSVFIFECSDTFNSGYTPLEEVNFEVIVNCTRTLLKYGLPADNHLLLNLCGHASMLKLLLQHGILMRRPNMTEKSKHLIGTFPPSGPVDRDAMIRDYFVVMHAIEKSEEAVTCMQLLSYYRVDLNLRDHLGRSWIQHAIAHRFHSLVSVLLQLRQIDHPELFEIDIDQKDSFGVSVRAEALASGFLEIVTAMKDRIKISDPMEIDTSPVFIQTAPTSPYVSDSSQSSQSNSIASRRRRDEDKWDKFHS